MARLRTEAPLRNVVVRQLLDSLGAVPGVQAVAVYIDQPFLGGGRREAFKVEGHDDPQPDRGHPASFNSVSDQFFQAMDIPQGESISIVVRTSGDPAALAGTIRSRIREADGDLAILKLQLLEQTLGDEVAEPRIYTLLLSVFAVSALVIATAGIYGMNAYAVVRRTREIGSGWRWGRRLGRFSASFCGARWA